MEFNLGGRDFDWKIMEFCDQKFSKKHGCSPLKNAKAKLKL